MAFYGIENVNEFYTHHYLSAILSGDLKQQLDAWRQQERERPEEDAADSALKKLWRPYFKRRERFDDPALLPEQARELLLEWQQELMGALGYAFRPSFAPLRHGFMPTLGVVNRPDGAPLLWCISVEQRLGDGSSIDVLDAQLVPEQLHTDEPAHYMDEKTRQALLAMTFDELLAQEVFSLEEPPRFVLLLGLTQAALIDRTKWFEKRLLRFDWPELLGRREDDAITATAALMARACLAPEQGAALLDTLDDSSHRHAYGVSKDLKYALREAIELIGNEVVHYRRNVTREAVFDDESSQALGEQLGRECLRYMYRLLFLFYLEARPELGYVPIKAELYRQGYSLEALRELELIELNSEESREGYFFHESIQRLFTLIYEGTGLIEPQEQAALDIIEDTPQPGAVWSFNLEPLKSHLFDPERTPLLEKVKLRNCVLQRVIELMSLTRPASRASRTDRRGRISYAQLGINQLGAVYESLLSYRGFFARTELYEVCPAGQEHDELETAYFVPQDALERYDRDAEIVRDPEDHERFLRHDKGKFIYRMAGRDREKSASYYTPEVLTRCLVKYTLKALLEDEDGKLKYSADELLKLTICEPAMGSAAFLNEAVNQLSELYLTQRQREVIQAGGAPIPHDRYALERQKVKMFYADNNVFGVDLNPVAVELAEVSLWLNTIYQGAYVPWFGMQLVCGNSLIGARREHFSREQTRKKSWQGLIPTRIEPGQRRPEGAIYHFLLGDDGMADYTDAVIKGKGGKNPVEGLAADEVAKIVAWRKEFNKPLSAEDRSMLLALCERIDELWRAHTELLRDMRQRTTDPLDIYGFKQSGGIGGDSPSSTRDKDEILNGELYSYKSTLSSPFRRLKLVMDYWCALWFWPIERADYLPTREDFLYELGLVLSTDIAGMTVAGDDGEGQQSLFGATMAPRFETQLRELGQVNVLDLFNFSPRLDLANKLGQQYRFFHWELEFADLFEDRGGFDVILGNPPWLNVEWNEAGVLGDADPYFVLKKLSANEAAQQREETLEKYNLKSAYLSAYEEIAGMSSFLNAGQNYPVLKGTRTNLYKCFIPKSWTIIHKNGAMGLFHQQGLFDDPHGGELRQFVYEKSHLIALFRNQLKLFEDVDNNRPFCFTILHGKAPIDFQLMTSLMHPSTLEDSFNHDGLGDVVGFKDESDNWSLSGHRARLININNDALTAT